MRIKQLEIDLETIITTSLRNPKTYILKKPYGFVIDPVVSRVLDLPIKKLSKIVENQVDGVNEYEIVIAFSIEDS